jgi:Holliday junction resolvase RusA-like endonuclease
MNLHLIIPGDPVGKGRPRFTQGGIAFTPKRTRNHEAYIKALFVQKYPRHEPLAGPLEMEIIVAFPIPKSASKKRRQDMLWQREMPTRRPDVDNLCKAFMDALGAGVAYRDDAQIVSLAVIKQYSNTPQTEVKIRNVGEEP